MSWFYNWLKRDSKRVKKAIRHKLAVLQISGRPKRPEFQFEPSHFKPQRDRAVLS